MTKEGFLIQLYGMDFTDYPILKQISQSSYEIIMLYHNREDRGYSYIYKLDMRLEGACARLTEHWIRYNKWLDRWYADNSPGSHLSGYNEQKTTLRAQGWSDATIDKHIKKEHKMADGNLRMKAIKILVKLIDEMAGHVDDPTDEEVGRMVNIIEEGLHEAHALGVVAGREGM